jgi:putative ABC transport system permease protein
MGRVAVSAASTVGSWLGSAAAGLLALALLVSGCVFAALAGPAVSLHTRTEALEQTLAVLGSATKAVGVSADWTSFTSEMNAGQTMFGFGHTEDMTRTQVTTTESEIGTGLATTPLPLAPGHWAGLSSRLITVTSGAARSAYTIVPPKMEVVYRDTLTSNAELAAGSYAHGKLPPGWLAATVTPQTAARFGLHPGSRLRLAAPTGTVTVVVTAILRARDPASTFWTTDSTTEIPSLSFPPKLPFFWAGAVIVDPDQLTAMQDALGTSGGLELQWEYPLALGGLTADQARGLADELAKAAVATPTLYGRLAGAADTTTTSSPLAQDLAVFLDTQAAVQTVLLLLFVSLIVVGAAVILLAARMVVVRRRGELALLRSRGASLWQVAAVMLRGAVIAAGPAALAGAGLALAFGPHGAFPALGWALAGPAVLVALAGLPLIAVWQHRRAEPAASGAAVRSAAGWRAPGASSSEPHGNGGHRRGPRRLVAEVAAVAACVAGLVVLHHQGLSAGGAGVSPGTAGGADLYPAAAPVLLAVPVVLVMLRLYPLAIGGLLRLSSRRGGATGFVALAGAARSSLTNVLPVFALVLALSLATFAGMVRTAIARGQVAASWQATGADVVVNDPLPLAPVGPAAERAIAAVPGVRRVAAVWDTLWSAPGGQPVTVIGVDPASYAALVESTPFPAIAVASLGGALAGTGPVPVLASPTAAAALGRAAASSGPGPSAGSGQASGTGNGTGSGVQLTSQLAMGPIGVRIAGTVASVPVQPPGSAFLVMAVRRLPGAAGTPGVNQLLITGSGIDNAAMSAVVARMVPGASIAFRSAALSALTSSPLQHGASLILPLTVATSAGFGLFILMLGMALGSADRAMTLARLATMGMQRTTRLVLLEALPAVLLAVAAGVACALALPPLVGSAVDLSVFTGSGAPVPVRPDWVSLGLPAAAMLLIAAAALTVEARTQRRRGVTAMLRAN